MAKESKEVQNLKKKNKKIKKALRSYDVRLLKNVFIWFVGMVCGVVFFFGGIGAALKFVPMNKLTGGNEQILSNEFAQNSVIDALLNINKYGVEDMPIVRDTILSVFETSGLNKIIEFDGEKFSSLKFSYSDDRTFINELKSCVAFVASLNSLGVTSMMGDLSNVSVFKEYRAITLETDKPSLDENGNIAKDGENFLSNPQLYYYQTTQDGSVVYKRAFDDQGVRLCALEEQLYFPNIADIPILDATKVMSETMATVEINELLSVFGAGSSFGDSFLGGFLEGKRIGDLSSIEQSDILLKDILGEKTAENEKMYDILTDLTGKSEQELTLADLSSFNIDELHLAKVMPTPNQMFQSILVDAFIATYPTDTYENIKLSDLSGGEFSFDSIKIKTVLGEESSNPIIATLINKNSSIGSIASDIDSLTLYEVYGHNCFIEYVESSHSGMLRYTATYDGNGNLTGYIQDDNGGFVIDTKSGIWSLLCFDSSDMIESGDHAGRYNTYTVSDETMNDLQQHTGTNSISEKITNASIRQLVDIGIVASANSVLYTHSLQEALNLGLS